MSEVLTFENISVIHAAHECVGDGIDSILRGRFNSRNVSCDLHCLSWG